MAPLLNPHLRAVARWRVGGGVLDDGEFEKSAQPPDMAGGGGGAPPMPDPMAGGGGAPPMGGGAPPPPPGPLDPATLAQITQAIGGAGGAMGAGAGPNGKVGGKKAEQQLLDTKLWTIQFLLVKVCEALNVQVPPSIVVGPPPEQGMMQQAQQEQAAPAGGGTTMQGPDAGAGGGGGAPPGPGPIPPMDASQGPIGGAPGGGGTKMGSAIYSLSSLMEDEGRRSFDVGSEYALESLRNVQSKAAAMAALSRSLKNGGA